MSKTLDAWELIREPTYSQAKREAQKKNTKEEMQANNHWTSLVAIKNALDETIVPRLLALTEQKDTLSNSDKWQYFEMMMFAIMVSRPCRPSTYYAA